MAEVKYIIFVLGKQKFGINLAEINGIEQNYNVVPSPFGAKDIKGMIHLRNEIIPVLDLKSRFLITEEADVVNKQLLVSDTHGMLIGVEVDDMIGIVTLDESEVRGVPDAVYGVETEYLEGVIRVSVDTGDSTGSKSGKPEVIICVGIDKILTDNEFSSVSDALEKRKNAEEKND